jgi:hypothetical protein
MILVLVLCALGVAFLFRRDRRVQLVLISIFFLVGAIALCRFSLVFRIVHTEREAVVGGVTEEFLAGAGAAVHQMDLSTPYLFASVVGLAFIAYVGQLVRLNNSRPNKAVEANRRPAP